MSDTKMQIIAAILKQDEFRAIDIVREVGCSRQLVHHHLTKMSEEGFLVKKGQVYTVADSRSLIDALASGGSKKTLTSTFCLKSVNLEGMLNTISHAQVLMMPSNLELRKKVLEDIEDSINSLKNLRHGIVNNQLSMPTVRREFSKSNVFDDYLNVYMKYVKDFDVRVSRDECMYQLIDALKEED